MINYLSKLGKSAYKLKDSVYLFLCYVYFPHCYDTLAISPNILTKEIKKVDAKWLIYYNLKL